jgi:thiamine biosynthesis lipoprotein
VTENTVRSGSDFRFEAIGAPWSIQTRDDLDERVAARIVARIDDFDRTWSRFRSDSLVSRIATTPGRYALPADAGPLLDLYRRLYDVTGGSVSPLVGRRLEHLGYDAAYSFRASADPASVPAWDERVLWDGTHVTTTTPVTIDVGAAGKGYLVDIVAGILDDEGQDDYVVNASGDLLHRGPEPARVALEHPFDTTMAIGVVELRDGALCASAPNRRTWGEGLHHIIDATTGQPTTAIAATWAFAPSALVADGLATALFFTDHTTLASTFELASLRMLADGRVEASPNFEGELFS